MELNEDDVMTLLGYATILRHDGKVDMPAYFYSLAERIAKTMNDEPMAQRVRDVAAQEVPNK